MQTDNRILLPVDFSECSLSAIEIATQQAKLNNATLCFVYVAPPILPEEAIYGSGVTRRSIEDDKQAFEQLRPSDSGVSYEHLFLRGNAGPEIVRATKNADLCIMSTHGRGGLARIVLGSVAQYVLRHAKCPVILIKGFIKPQQTDDATQQAAATPEEKHSYFVTDVMRQVVPIQEFNKIDDVISLLDKSNETAAPVVDGSNNCIGILTTNDIDKYKTLRARYEAGDESVVKEMFEVDKYNHVRTGNYDFDQVNRHMTPEVITIRNDQSIQDALTIFDANPEIHHLVVLDEDNHPVGMVDLACVSKAQADALGNSDLTSTESSVS